MAECRPQKKLPTRKCTGCGEHFPKNTLIRVLRTPEGEIVLDLTGKKNGRGAYICKSVIKLFFKGSSPVGIVRVADGDEENKTVLRINAISQNIPDKLVAMPIGYTKQ